MSEDRQTVPPEGTSSLPEDERAAAIPSSPSEAPAKRSPDRPRSVLGMVVEIVIIVAAAFAIAMLVQLFIVKPFTIPSVSMEPTLMVGDRVLVNRLTYHFRDPRRGDVVVFPSPIEDENLIKRIVAVGGDTVEVKDGALYLNGQRQAEPQLKDQTIDGVFPLTTIPAGYVFMMGDNRNDSADSRVFGPVSTKALLGKAFVVYWPIRRWHGL
jgi:signal peptidase I